jgi:DNA-binding transcriptional MerR regulator
MFAPPATATGAFRRRKAWRCAFRRRSGQAGSRLRVAGKGNAGSKWAARRRSVHHGSRGAASVLPPRRRRYRIHVPVTVSEAGLGAKIEVPTIDGRALLKVPQGTQNGQKFRLREKGVMNTRKNKRGDEIVEVVIQAPKVHDERTKELLRELSQVDNPEDPRAAMEQGVNMAKAKSKAAYMISAVAEQYQIHPQTLRLYEREGLLAPSRSEGNTRLYTDDDLERLEVILKLTRDLGVNLAGVEIILNMREKMAAMQQQIEDFVSYPGDSDECLNRPGVRHEETAEVRVLRFFSSWPRALPFLPRAGTAAHRGRHRHRPA